MNADVDILIQARKARWLRFYDLSSEVRFLLEVQFNEEFSPRPWPNPEQKQARIEWAWKKYQVQMERLNWLEDDALPFLDPYTGTEIFAEAFGCQIYRPEDNMPFALPLVSSAAEAEKIKAPDWSATPLAMLFEIADELRRRAGNQALVRLVDIQSPMDIAALIWDKNTFYPALLETPEAVLLLADKVRQLLTSFLDAWFTRYGREFIAHYPDYYMADGLTLSEDEVGSVNSRMFEKYFLPELAELSRRYGGLGMHCCAHARHQWQGFKHIPGLRMLNFVQPLDKLEEAQIFFEKHTAQIHDWPIELDLASGPSAYPPALHAVLRPAVNTREQAIETVHVFQEKFKNE